MGKHALSNKQRGLVSLEFALMFVLIFMLFYGLIGYSIPLLLGATYQQLAADGLREAVRSSSIYSLDTSDNEALASYQKSVQEVVDESWLPDKWAIYCKNYGEHYLKVNDNLWSVCIRNPEVKKILPAFKIFNWEVPKLPDEIKGEAKLRIR